MKIHIAVLFTLVSTVSLAQSQPPARPFGLQMGTPVSQLQRMPGFQRASATSTDVYLLTPPTPNPEFEQYMVLATPQAGLCKVVALGRTYRADSYGDTLRSRFGNLQRLLTERYGQPEVYDFVKRDSIWREPRDFAMGLRMNERYLDAFWVREDLPRLPNDLESIALTGKGLSSTETYLTLSYEFMNMEACQREVRARGGQGL